MSVQLYYLGSAFRQTALPEVLECGHIESAHESYTRGYSTDCATGKRYCYDCSYTRDLQAMNDGSTYYGYLDTERREVTNWIGYRLVSLLCAYPIRQSLRNNRTLVYWRGIDTRGNVWYGRCSGSGMITTMHKAK